MIIDKLTEIPDWLDHLLGAANIHIDVIDSDFNIKYIDKGWVKCHGPYDGQKCYKYFMDRKEPCAVCGVTNAIATKQKTVTDEVMPKENDRPIRVFTVPFQNSKGEWHVAEVNLDRTTCKHVEDELIKEREYFRKIYNVMDDVIVTTLMPDRKMLFFNNSLRKVFGYDPDECVGKNDRMLYPDEASFLKMGSLMYSAMRDRKDSFITENLMKRKTGEVFLAEISVSFFRIEGGTLHAIAIIRDISQRNEIEERLKKSERYYRALAELSKDYIFIIDEKLCLQYVNGVGAKLLRREPCDIIGRTLNSFFPEDTFERQKKSLMRVFRSRSPLYVEGITRYKNKEKWFSTWLTPLAYDGGKVTSVMGVSRDISKQKHTEAAIKNITERLQVIVDRKTSSLSKANAKLKREIIERLEVEKELERSLRNQRNIVDSAPFGIYVVNNKGNIEYVNEAMLQISGDTRRQFTSINIFKLRAYKKSHLVDKIRSVLRGKSFRLESVEYTSQFGKKTTVRNFFGIPFQDSGERKAIVVVEDITAQKEAEGKLLKAQKDLIDAKRLSDVGTLAATAAHELRNPLATIKTAAYNVRRKNTNPNIVDNLRNIETGVADANQIINNLLSYARIKMPYFEEVDMCKLVKECITSVRERFCDDDRILIKNIRKTDRYIIDADITHMREIMTNILVNAIESCAGNSCKIGVTLSLTPNNLFTITVKDNGIGISRDDIGHLFVPFYTTKKKGVGLGLAVCNQLVGLHGGDIKIDSVKGRGTTVTIFLPCKKWKQTSSIRRKKVMIK